MNSSNVVDLSYLKEKSKETRELGVEHTVALAYLANVAASTKDREFTDYLYARVESLDFIPTPANVSKELLREATLGSFQNLVDDLIAEIGSESNGEPVEQK